MKRPLRVSTYLAGVTLFALASIAAKCTITVAPGEQTGNLNLNLPYRSQPGGSYLCAPACVLMWRLYDGRPEMSLEQIRDQMGCFPGCWMEDIPNGVNLLTRTYDTQLEGWEDGQGAFLEDLQAWLHARQLHSLSKGVPVIAVIGSWHAVLPNKGNYATAMDGKKRWDTVYVHDPEPSGGPNRYWIAGNWMNLVQYQVISAGALMGWDASFATHGGVHVRGWWGTRNGPYIPVP